MSAGNPASMKRLVPWIVYLIFFAVLNETVFNVSTPMIARQFSLTPSGVSWMMTIFMVFFGIGSVIYGRLSDLYSPGPSKASGVRRYRPWSSSSLPVTPPMLTGGRSSEPSRPSCR